METYNTTLDQLLIEIDKSMNEKISNINYLEVLKFKLIEKFDDLEKNKTTNLKLMPPNGKILEKEVDLSNRKLIYKIEYHDKSISTIRQKIENDYLSLTLEGLKSITIYDDSHSEKYIYSNLSKNMGIVLSLNTMITTKIIGKSIILSILIN